MPKNPTKRGYKIWVQGDPTTGHMTQFDSYRGKPPNCEAFSDDCLGSRVVKIPCHTNNSDEFERQFVVLLTKYLTKVFSRHCIEPIRISPNKKA